MMIGGSTVLVTGANRGLGRALVRALAEAGCAKVYAAARNVASIASDSAVQPVELDITKTEQVAAAAARCHDVEILINNAGVAGFTPALGAPTVEHARLEMETNYFGTLAMCRAFAPVLKRNGGGVLVNMLSVVSWFNAPVQGSYCASKAAEWSLTRAARFELRAQGTLVVGVYAVRRRARMSSPRACSPELRTAARKVLRTSAPKASMASCSRTMGRFNRTCRRPGTTTCADRLREPA